MENTKQTSPALEIIRASDIEPKQSQLAQAEKTVAAAEKKLAKVEATLETSHKIAVTYGEIDSMGKKGVTGKYTVTPEEMSTLKTLVQDGGYDSMLGILDIVFPFCEEHSHILKLLNQNGLMFMLLDKLNEFVPYMHGRISIGKITDACLDEDDSVGYISHINLSQI